MWPPISTAPPSAISVPAAASSAAAAPQPGYATLLNKEKGISAYFNSNYSMGDNANFYTSVLYGKNEAKNDSGSRFWIPNYNDGTDGYIWNQTEQTLETYQHIFSPEEQGVTNFTTDSTSYNIALGRQRHHRRFELGLRRLLQPFRLQGEVRPAVAAGGRDGRLLPGTVPRSATGHLLRLSGVRTEQAAFYQSITPEQFRAFSGNLRNTSSTWTHNFNVQLTNPDLFQLPAGPVGMAGVFQLGYQHWDNPVDPGVSGDDYFGLSGTSGSGNRANRAVGVEFSIPLLKSLTASVSGRYDSYKNIRAGSDAKATYKLGLGVPADRQPAVARQLRHRVPRPGHGLYVHRRQRLLHLADRLLQVRDLRAGPGDCPFEGLVAGRRAGGEPGPEVDHRQVLRLRLRLVAERPLRIARGLLQRQHRRRGDDRNRSRTLFDENECRQGRLESTRQPAWTRCRVIQRGPLNANPLLSEIGATGRRSRRSTSPKDRSAASPPAAAPRFDWGRWGEFGFGLDYNLTLDHTTVTFPGDPETDLLSPQQALSAEFKSVLTGDISWQKDDWSANVHGIRYGSTPNYAAQFGIDAAPGTSQGRIGPHMLYNMSVSYELTEKSALSLTVNNVLRHQAAVRPHLRRLAGFRAAVLQHLRLQRLSGGRSGSSTGSISEPTIEVCTGRPRRGLPFNPSRQGRGAAVAAVRHSAATRPARADGSARAPARC